MVVREIERLYRNFLKQYSKIIYGIQFPNRSMCPKGTVLKEKKNRYGARLLAGMKGYPCASNEIFTVSI